MKTENAALRWVGLVLCACLAGGQAQAKDIFVSPKGTAQGDGSKDNPLDIETALSAAGPAKPGDAVVLTDGVYSAKPDKNGRPAPLALAVSGTAEQPIRVMSAPGAAPHINGVLAITGSYVNCVGLEIGDADWKPSGGRLRGEIPAVAVTKNKGVKLTNCNIFGAPGGGVSANEDAVDFEMYGCLVHDFGYLQTQQVPMDIGDIESIEAGIGTGLLAANREGTKAFTHNVFYRGCGGNIQVSTFAVGMDFIENVSCLSKGLKPNESMDSFPICSNYQRGDAVPMDRIRLIGNVAYQPSDISAWRPNARLLSYRGEVLNGSAVFKDNYVMGAARALDVTYWKDLEVSGNTFWGTQGLVGIALPKGADAKEALKGYKFDDNTYVAGADAAPFYCADGKMTFQQWQAMGLDAKGRLLPGKDGRPTETKVLVFPNRHQKGRAGVAAFRWDGGDSVEADLSKVLTAGREFRVYNCLDITHTIGQAKPVLAAAYDGKPVRLPLRRDPLSPNFDVFLILPEGE